MLRLDGSDRNRTAVFGHTFRFPVVLAGIVLLGLVLRLYRLDWQSVWYDEVFALSVSRLPLAHMSAALVQDVVHPPLHYYALHWWFQLVGFGPLEARILSAIFGTVSVLLIWLLARYLFDGRTALLAALLLACSQLAVAYSQEARAYSQFLLLFLAFAYASLRALREKRLYLWIASLCLGALLIYTHYYGFFVLAAFVLFALIYYRRDRLAAKWLAAGLLCLGLLYIPWLSSGIIGETLYGQKFHSGAYKNPPAEHWYTFATVLNTFNNGRTNGVLESSPWWTFVAGALLFSLPAAFALRPLASRPGDTREAETNRENLVYLALLSAVPILLAFAAGAFAGFYNIRYVAFCAAPYYVLVARGISLGNSALRWALIVFIACYSARALWANYFIACKEDYRNALASVARDYRPGDCAVVAPPWEERQARWAWSIYEGSRPGPPILPLSSVGNGAGCSRVWLVSVYYRWNPPAVKEADTARQSLSRIDAQPEKRRFFWMEVDLYNALRGKIHAASDAAR